MKKYNDKAHIEKNYTRFESRKCAFTTFIYVMHKILQKMVSLNSTALANKDLDFFIKQWENDCFVNNLLQVPNIVSEIQRNSFLINMKRSK